MWPQSNPRKKRSSIGQLGVAILAILTAFTFLPGMLPLAGSLPEAEAQAPVVWEFVDDVPGSADGYTPRRVWTAERDVLYVLTGRSSPTTDAAVWRYDHGGWHHELDMPGYDGTSLFGTGPSDVYAAFWADPDVQLYRFDGASWTAETLPPEINRINTVAGVPGDVQLGDASEAARNTGAGWTVVPHDPGINVWPRTMTYVAPDEAYMASCWGHGWWNGLTWEKKFEFDFCDVAELWGARTGTGDLNLWAVGTNNFGNGIRIWRYDEAARSFGSKYGAEVMDPPGTAHRTGQATSIWGSGPDDVWVSAYRWVSYPTDASARVYHYDGAGWTSRTDFPTLDTRLFDVWGSAADDVWFVVEDGRLLHYGQPLVIAPTWDFVAEIPGAQDGRFARKIWTGERDVLYALTMTNSLPYDMQVWRFDRGAWHLELDLPGHYGNFVFGTGPDDVYAGGYTCLQPDGSWTCPAGGADASPVYHFDGAGWSELAMPPVLDGRVVHTIAGVPGEVQIGAGNRYVVRDGGAGWEVVYDAGGGFTVGPSVMTMLAPNEGYMASCWGHAWWDGNSWTKKGEFDFCDLYDMWGARTGTGELNLWAAGNNNFQNGVRIWRYAEAARSFGAKYAFEFGDPPTGTAREVGTASAMWGAAPDDVYATGCMWEGTSSCDFGRIYHSTGDGAWAELTGMGPIPSVADVWGTAADDVWFSLLDGQLLHYGTAPSYPALPWFNVDPDGGWVWGHGWTPGAALGLDIDGTGFGATVDGSGDWGIDTRPFDIAPGQRLSADDGTFIKSLVVTDLTITGVDEAFDRVTGTAAPGSTVLVGIHAVPDWRQVTADASGNWTADFSVPGDGFGAFDIVPGTGGYAHQHDPDGDSTHPHWRVPKPTIGVDAGRDEVSGNEFAYPATVTVSVNGTPVATAGTDEWGNFGTPPLPVDIVVGDTVTADDGTNNTSHVVLALEATAADPAADTVTGTAPNGSQVDVWVHDVPDVNRTVFADPSGHWTADFTPAGATHPNDRGTADLVPGSNGNSNRCDAEGNCTYSQWRVADPYITASVIHEEVWATDFPDEPAGQMLHYRLSDPGGIVFESDMPLIVTPWGTEAGDRSFGRFDVAAGQTLTVRNRPFDQPLDGGLERVLAISDIEVTGIDAIADTISGYADPAQGGYLCVWSQDAQLCSDHPDFSWVGTDWTADFGAIGSDVRAGHWNSASQYEADGDETHFWWNLPPWVVVEMAEADVDGTPVYGAEWPHVIRLEQWQGPMVSITVNGAPAGDVLVDPEGNGSLEYVAPLLPGNTIIATDGIDTKDLTIEDLTIDDAFPMDALPPDVPNSVVGAAPSDRDVRVQMTANYGWWAERWVRPDASDNWLADFGNPGNGWREQWTALFGSGGISDVFAGGDVFAEIYDGDNDRTWAVLHPQADPRIIVVRGNDRVEALDFPDGATVTIAIDDPATTESPDYTDSGVVTPKPGEPWETLLVFELGDFTVPEAATVTGSDGVTTVTHDVPAEFALGIVDPGADTVSGTAPDGAEIAVEADGQWRYVTADVSGEWLADFSVSGTQPGEEQPVDIGPGSSGRAALLGSAGSATEILWRLSAAHFNVDVASQGVWGHEWEPFSDVTVTIGGADYGPFPASQWGDFNAQWDPAPGFAAGQTITVTDGTTTKSHDVTSLTVVFPDPLTDQVHGTAAAGSDLAVWVHDPTNPWRSETADGGGNWTADFSIPGDEGNEQTTFDLQPGIDGNSAQCDADNDCTFAHWRIPNAQFNVEVPSQGVWGHEWQAYASVTVTIGAESWTFPTDGFGNFNAGWDPAPGFAAETTITVTDGSSTKTHEVTFLAVTEADWITDTVSGTAAAGSRVDAWVHGPGNVGRSVVAHGGVWSVDFGAPGPNPGEEATFDLQPGTDGNSSQCDADGDCTIAGWWIVNPTFSVRMSEQQVHGYDWDEGVPVTLSIDDPATGDANPATPEHDPDYEATATPGPAEWDPNQTFVWFAPLEDAGFELQAEFEVAMSDGTTTKTHTVTPLEVTDVDRDANTVSGLASAEAWVDVHIHGSGAHRTVQADIGGKWTANFSLPGAEHWEQETYDIDFGTNGEANESDDDGDNTNVQWRLVNPTFTVNAEGDHVYGDEWAANAPITVTFEGGLVATSESDDGGHFDLDLWDQYDIQPDRLVTVTDGAHTKTHVVTGVAVAEADADTDTVTGTAAPGATVEVEVHTPLEGMVWEHLVFQLGPGRFDRNADSWNEHLDFRRAVAHAIDRQALVAAIPGAGYAIDSHIDGYLPAFGAGGWAQYGHDTAAAAVLIDGLCASLDRTCTTNPPVAVFTTTAGNADRELMAALLQPMLGAAGIDMEIELEDAGTFFGPTLEHGTFDLGEWAWADEPTHQGLRNWHQSIDPDERWGPNYYGWGTPRFAELVGLMHETDDPAILDSYFAEAEQILADHVPFIPLYVRAETFEVEGSTALTVTANELGEWTAHFSGIFDLMPGTEGSASEYDEDGDSTRAHWRVPNPAFVVSATHDLVAGGEFDPGGTATITIDDNTDPDDGLLFETTTEIDPWEGGFLVPLADEFDVQAGQLVTVTDGNVTKATWVTEVVITGVDEGADHVAGTAAAGAEIEVEAEHAVGRSRRTVTSDGSWLADFSVPGEGDEAEPLDLQPGVIVAATESDEDGDATLTLAEIPAFVEGNVLLDGQPLPDVEVFLAPDRYTCTDTNGYFSFDGVSVVHAAITGGGFAATGPNPGSPCGNPAFVDADGKPLLVAFYTGFDLFDGYEYVPFDVARAAAYQTVLVEEFDGAEWVPLDGVPVHAYDRAVVGDPDPAQYPGVIAAGEGVLWSWQTTHGVGAELRYAAVADVLILVEMPDGTVLGDPTAATEFTDRGDGVLLGPTIVFPNQPPVITEVAGPDFPLLLGTPAVITVEYTDPNVHDSHSVSFEWGDGTVPTDSGEHTYTAPGIYEVTVTVTDVGGLAASATFRYVVVYDPSGGFVTGGGWFHPDPSSDYPGMEPADKVSLGFNVKYKNNSTEPQGELNVQLGGMHVHSDAIDWLVISLENEAYFSGLATIAGGSELYPFRVNVFDADADIEADSFEMLLYPPGADPHNDAALHHARGDLQGGQVKIHPG